MGQDLNVVLPFLRNLEAYVALYIGENSPESALKDFGLGLESMGGGTYVCRVGKEPDRCLVAFAKPSPEEVTSLTGTADVSGKTAYFFALMGNSKRYTHQVWKDVVVATAPYRIFKSDQVKEGSGEQSLHNVLLKSLGLREN